MTHTSAVRLTPATPTVLPLRSLDRPWLGGGRRHHVVIAFGCCGWSPLDIQLAGVVADPSSHSIIVQLKKREAAKP